MSDKLKLVSQTTRRPDAIVRKLETIRKGQEELRTLIEQLRGMKDQTTMIKTNMMLLQELQQRIAKFT